MASSEPGSLPLARRHRMSWAFGVALLLSVFLVLMAGCTLYPIATDPMPSSTRPTPTVEPPAQPRPTARPTPQSSAWSYAGHEVIARASANQVGGLSFTPDGRYLVVLGRDGTSGTLSFFDFSSGLIPVCTHTSRPGTYFENPKPFSVSPDSRLAAYGDKAGRVVLVRVGRDCSTFAEYQVSNRHITGLDFSVDGEWVYAATLNTLHRLPTSPGSAAPVVVDSGGYGNHVEMLAAGRDSIYTVAKGGQVSGLHHRSLHRPDFGQVVDFVRFSGLPMSLDVGEVSPSRLQVVAVAGQNFIFVRWRGQESGNVLIPVSRPEPIEVRLTADGTAIVTVTAFGSVQVWDYRAQAVSFTFELSGASSGRNWEGRIIHAAPSPDGKHLALATMGGELLLTGNTR